MGTYTELLKLSQEQVRPKASGRSSGARSPAHRRKPAARQPEPEIKNSRNQDVNQEINQDFKISRFLDFATPLLDEKPTYMQSFNYPPFVIEALDRLVLELKAKGRSKNRRLRWSPTKTTVFIMAILYLIWDYQESGEDSILHLAVFGR